MTRYGFDERNLARLNPVLALSRVHTTLTGWSKTVLLDAHGVVQLTCDAGKYQAPHGVDADVIFALLTAYHLQGRLEDHTVRVSVGYICDLVGLARTPAQYKRVQESIQRLMAVKFHTEAFWAKQTKRGWHWASMSFGIIDFVGAADEFEDGRDLDGKYRQTTSLAIRLNKELVASIQNDYTRKIDLDFYVSLKHPSSRLLYRILEERKQITESKAYQVPIVGWGEHLGFYEIDASKPMTPSGIPHVKVFGTNRIRRALDPAHEELLRREYLSDVTISGYASKQTITYTFSNNSITRPVDMEIVGMLMSCDISKPVAVRYAQEYKPEDIRLAVKRLNIRIDQKGYKAKSKAGLVIDMLKNPERYDNIIDDSEKYVVLNKIPQSLSTPVSLEEEPMPERNAKQAEAMLVNALKSNKDQDLRKTLIEAFVAGHFNAIDLARLNQMSDNDANAQAKKLLDQISN